MGCFVRVSREEERTPWNAENLKGLQEKIRHRERNLHTGEPVEKKRR